MVVLRLWLAQSLDVAGVYCLVDIVVEIQVLHNINFTRFGPRQIRLRHHPNCRPKSLRLVEASPDVNAAVANGAHTSAIQSSREEFQRILILLGPVYSPQLHNPALHLYKRIKLRHMAIPRRAITQTTLPRCTINLITANLVRPHQSPPLVGSFCTLFFRVLFCWEMLSACCLLCR